MPIDAKNVTILTLSKTRKALSYTVDEYGGYSTAFKDILNHDFKVLGEVTKDEISFDVEPYVRKVTLGYWLDYCNTNKRHDIMSSTPNDSFRSLLQSKGIDLNKENVKRIILEKL